MTETTRPMIRIHNITTDKIVDREMNDKEFVAHELQLLENEARLQEEEAKAAARLVTLAKLEALGLTPEDLAAL